MAGVTAKIVRRLREDINGKLSRLPLKYFDSNAKGDILSRIVKGTKNVHLFWQVSTDARFYPKALPTHKRLWREEGFVLCTDCVQRVYPQGRAKDNNLPWQAKASKCFNVRAITKQMPSPSIGLIVESLLTKGFFCTPAIGIDGSIRLGESFLCPKVTSIYEPSTSYFM